MHRKEEAVAPALLSTLGLLVVPARGLDTDQLGTFSGEVPREGSMLDVAMRKARLGMSATGLPLGIASEGTFGPHPAIPFFPAGSLCSSMTRGESLSMKASSPRRQILTISRSYQAKRSNHSLSASALPLTV
jgi:hypothetical protein